jgi:hypothetical protein
MMWRTLVWLWWNILEIRFECESKQPFIMYHIPWIRLQNSDVDGNKSWRLRSQSEELINLTIFNSHLFSSCMTQVFSTSPSFNFQTTLHPK